MGVRALYVSLCVLVCAMQLGVSVTCATGGENGIVSPNWTIGTDGRGRWAYGQYSQMGPRGFFGPYDIDRSASGNFAPLNGWMGVQNYQNSSSVNILASGANSTSTALDMELNPKADLGWASVGGRYKIVPYDTGTAKGAEVSISAGQWTNWGIGTKMPIGGAIFVGKSSFHRGTGLQFSWNRTQEYILFESDAVSTPDFMSRYFPRLVRHAVNKPIRRVEKKICKKPPPCGGPDCNNGTQFILFGGDDAEVGGWLAKGAAEEVNVCAECPSGTYPLVTRDPHTNEFSLYTRASGTVVYDETSEDSAYMKIGFGILPWERDSLITTAPAPIIVPITLPDTWNGYDVNLAQRTNLLSYFIWYNDVLDVQVGGLFSSSHAGPELARTTDTRVNYVPTDRYTSEGWAFAEYNNNRLRLRAELDWYNRETRYQRSLSGWFFNIDPAGKPAGSGSVFAPEFIQSLRFMADASIHLGPTVLTLFYSHMPGPDRRHGILIKKQPYVNGVQQVGLDPFLRFSSLLGYRYGAGMNSPGDLADASVIAGRIDYSLAANLMLSASFLHATRVSHGYGWGWIRPAVTTARFGLVDYDPDLGTFLPAGNFAFTENIPAIPSHDLGWEASAGICWQLLDQFSAEVTISYWQPGKWFNYACVDRSVPNWDVPTAANNWGTNPNRTIDAVLGMEVALLSSF